MLHSIFEEWSAQSEEEGHPFIKRERIIHEFDKRKKQSTTKDAKAKLDLRGCDLSDNHVSSIPFSANAWLFIIF